MTIAVDLFRTACQTLGVGNDKHIHRFLAQFERGTPVDRSSSPTYPEILDGLIEAYRDAWKARYGVFPKPIEPKERVECFDFLATNYSLAQGKRIIAVFLEMEEPKFLEDAHGPLRLRWNLQKVLAEIGKRKSKPKGPQIQISYWCGHCQAEFLHHVSNDPVCPNCS